MSEVTVRITDGTETRVITRSKAPRFDRRLYLEGRYWKVLSWEFMLPPGTRRDLVSFYIQAA
jgi:hypothetical protein